MFDLTTPVGGVSIVSKECTFTKTAVARELVDAILLQCGCGIYAKPFDWVILPRQVEFSRFPHILLIKQTQTVN